MDIEEYNNLQKDLVAAKQLLLNQENTIVDLTNRNLSLIYELDERDKEQENRFNNLKDILATYILKEIASEKLAEDRGQAHVKVIDLYRNKLNQLETNEFMDDRNEQITVLKQEIETLKTVNKDLIKFNQTIASEKEVLRTLLKEKNQFIAKTISEKAKLESTISAQINRYLKDQEIITKLEERILAYKTQAYNEAFKSEVILNGQYKIVKLNKIQGMASDFVKVDESLLHTDQDEKINMLEQEINRLKTKCNSQAE